MKIIEYKEEYQKEVKELLQELQDYIAKIDKEGYNIVTPKYKDYYFQSVIEKLNKYDGKILLAQQENKIVGCVIGMVNNEKIKTYDFQAPKRGEIVDLIVSKDYRHQGIGKMLLKEMENYLKKTGCQGVLLEVFSYNKNARVFYENDGYFERTSTLMKKI